VPSWRAASSNTSAQRDVGTAGDVRETDTSYYSYNGASGADSGAAATADGGPVASSAAAAAAAADVDGGAAGSGTAAWPGGAEGSDYYNYNSYGDYSTGWSGATGEDDGGSGAGTYFTNDWTPPSEWGEYELPGEWGQRPRAAATSQAGGGAGASAAAAGADPYSGGPAYGGGAPPLGQDGASSSSSGGGFGGGGFGPFDADSYRGGAAAGGSPPPRPGGAQSRGWGTTAGPAPDWSGGGGPLLPSDITLITPRDAELVLPVLPTTDQARHYQPKSVPERVVQVLGSIGLSAALSKSALLAGPALLYPMWGPWIRAGLRNAELYLRQFKGLGLWRAQVRRTAARASGGPRVAQRPATACLQSANKHPLLLCTLEQPPPTRPTTHTTRPSTTNR